MFRNLEAEQARKGYTNSDVANLLGISRVSYENKKKTGKFTVVGVSVCGGVFHNVGQLAVAMAVVQTYEVGYYFPVLLIAGLLTGMLIGMISAEVLKRTKNLRLKE